LDVGPLGAFDPRYPARVAEARLESLGIINEIREAIR
jgi:hypothetical protein